MDYVVTSYYTTKYALYAKRLEESLEAQKVRYHYVLPIQDLGGWQKNTSHKPIWLKRMLDEFRPMPLVWIDADAIVRSSMDWLRWVIGDVAVCRWQYDKRAWEIMSGTVFLQNNDRARDLLDRWKFYADKYPDRLEQKALQQSIEEMGDELKVEWLGVEWCFIYDRFRRVFPKVEPIIEHFQASRQFRRENP